jgi:GntR family transcriptional regulator/MocR family aminotransferase
MANPSLYGLPSLRMEIARYLQVARGIHCTPDQVFITSGYRNAMTLIAHALLEPGDRVIIEDPGYVPTRQLLKHLGMQSVPVQVDGEGLQVAQVSQLAAGARAAVVTPAHQSPLCISLSLPRRMALLEWANRTQAWIIEDDYDGEYRYVSRPLPALKSLDRGGRVIYAGTFSKVLFPGIRIGYLVVPDTQVKRFEHIGEVFLGSCPELTQAIVATFMSEGHFSRHIQRMRSLYSERRRATIEGLRRALDPHVNIDQQPGGMHLILRLPEHRDDSALAEQLNNAGIYAEAMSDWHIEHNGSPGLLLGFANIPTEQDAELLGRRILQFL